MKYYKCSKCDNIFADEISDKFVKTMIKKCPVCGSSEVTLTKNSNSTNRKFIKKV